MTKLIDKINQATTATEVIRLQVLVQQSMLSSTEKRPLLVLLDAQLALVKAKIELGESFIVYSELTIGDMD